jgi:hypothetical protein
MLLKEERNTLSIRGFAWYFRVMRAVPPGAMDQGAVSR